MRLFLLITLSLFLIACPDNVEDPINIRFDAETSNEPDASPDSETSVDAESLADTSDDSCYYLDAWDGAMCDSPYIPVALVRGDRCAAPCEDQTDCPATCLCFSRACVSGKDLR